jgi:hypothetical protein
MKLKDTVIIWTRDEIPNAGLSIGEVSAIERAEFETQWIPSTRGEAVFRLCDGDAGDRFAAMMELFFDMVVLRRCSFAEVHDAFLEIDEYRAMVGRASLDDFATWVAGPGQCDGVLAFPDETAKRAAQQAAAHAERIERAAWAAEDAKARTAVAEVAA